MNANFTLLRSITGDGRNHRQYAFCLPAEGWPGWVGLGGWLHTFYKPDLLYFTVFYLNLSSRHCCAVQPDVASYSMTIVYRDINGVDTLDNNWPWMHQWHWRRLQQFRCATIGSTCCHRSPPHETTARQNHLKTDYTTYCLLTCVFQTSKSFDNDTIYCLLIRLFHYKKKTGRRTTTEKKINKWWHDGIRTE